MGSNMTGHLHDELKDVDQPVTVETRFGPVTGGKARNGTSVFLEIPYALPPQRFSDPQGLPDDYRYETRQYVQETRYGWQPLNDGQAAGSAFEDKVGYGQASENPLFVNIVSPPDFKPGDTPEYPVRVYIHGGFLQFGSPHGLSGQAQYISALRKEVWVNIGYRLSAYGFLANDDDHARLDGNYGFKDQWLALKWIKENVSTFGGNPDDIDVNGLSAGAHSVHQLLHHAARLPTGQKAPFTSAALQSNAIVVEPKLHSELREQFHALCIALGLDPATPNILDVLRDPERVSAQKIAQVIEGLGRHGTFRGVSGGSWWSESDDEDHRVDPMEFQRSGALARALRSKGVKSITLGDLSAEWYLYSIANPLSRTPDTGSWEPSIMENLERCFQPAIVARLPQYYTEWESKTGPAASENDALRMFGQAFADGQVHLPVRMLWRDLTSEAANEGEDAPLKVVRYAIRWTPEQVRPYGHVTHATDRVLWAYRMSVLKEDQAAIAREWLEAIDATVSGRVTPKDDFEHPILVLRENRTIAWEEDSLWESLLSLENVYKVEL